jgi:hypothetical protein
MQDRVTWVTSPAAVARNDQFIAEVKDMIRKLDKQTHHHLAMRIIREKEANAGRSLEEIMLNVEIDPLGTLQQIVCGSAALCMLNEVAIEKWGINGTEVDK